MTKKPLEQQVLRVCAPRAWREQLEARTVRHRPTGRRFRLCVVPYEELTWLRLRRRVAEYRCHFFLNKGSRTTRLSRVELVVQPQFDPVAWQVRLGGTSHTEDHSLELSSGHNPSVVQVTSGIERLLVLLPEERLERWIAKMCLRG
ncbi:MAG: hypothetical protein AAB460_01880 [Patescibacteria group bacterium]